MRKLVFMLTAFLLWSSVSYASPTITELPKNDKPYKFVAVYPKVSKEWKQVLKSYDGYLRFIYLDKDDKFIVSITETSEKNKKGPFSTLSTEQVIKDEDVTYYFDPWANRDKGGILRWTRGGIYFEMDSTELNKEEMLSLAKEVR